MAEVVFCAFSEVFSRVDDSLNRLAKLGISFEITFDFQRPSDADIDVAVKELKDLLKHYGSYQDAKG